MHLFGDLQQTLTDAAAAQAGCPVEARLQVPKPAAHADLTTSAAMHIAQLTGRPAAPIADHLARALASSPAIESVQVAGPGFVNMVLRASAFGAIVAEVLTGSEPVPSEALPTLMWARDRRQGAIKMAVARGLWPVSWTPDQVERLSLDVERQLLTRLALLPLAPSPAVPGLLDTLLRLFHEFYARVPVLSMEAGLARARLGLMEAAWRVAERQALRTCESAQSFAGPDVALGSVAES